MVLPILDLSEAEVSDLVLFVAKTVANPHPKTDSEAAKVFCTKRGTSKCPKNLQLFQLFCSSSENIKLFLT